MTGSGMMRIKVLLLLILITLSAEARMYQWVEPGVETTQLSGKPPHWYRSAEGGPRVFVFDNGRLIDDTNVKVSDEVRQSMRQEAFLLVEEDRQKAKEKMAKAQKLKEKLKKKETDASMVSSSDAEEEKSKNTELITDALFPEKEKEDVVENNAGTTDKSLEELKAMIADWEKSQTESAKKAIE